MQSKGLNYTVKKGEYVSNWLTSDVIEIPFEAGMVPTVFENYHPGASVKRADGKERTSPAKDEFLERGDFKKSGYPENIAMDRLYYPFQTKKVDFSDFWSFPHDIRFYARVYVNCRTDCTWRVELSTCGGMKVWVQGREEASFFPYESNIEARQEAELLLRAGTNEIVVSCSNYGERNIIFNFGIKNLSEEELEFSLPVSADIRAVQSVHRSLASMYLDRLTYEEGRITICADYPFEKDTVIEVKAGDVKKRKEVKAGSGEVIWGDTDELPIGYYEFTVCSEVEGVSLSAALGAEVFPKRLEYRFTPDTVEERKKAALDFIISSTPKSFEQYIAHLARGQNLYEEYRSYCEEYVEFVRRRGDCSDFRVVKLLWVLIKFGHLLTEEQRAYFREVCIGFRYWFDEPGNDAMWFFSENHALCFHTAQILAGELYPEEIFTNSGFTGREQSARAKKLIVEWLQKLLDFGYNEWNSPCYIPVDMLSYVSLLVLCRDEEVKELAGRALDYTYEIFAENSFHGLLAGACGRIYTKELLANKNLETNPLMWLAWGEGCLNGRVDPLIFLALSDYRPPEKLEEAACWNKEKPFTVQRLQGTMEVPTAIYKTKDYSIASCVTPRTGGPGSQELLMNVFLKDYRSRIWINHPGERKIFGIRRPGYFNGNGLTPLVSQQKNVVVLSYQFCDKLLDYAEADFTHMFCDMSVCDETEVGEHWAFLRRGDAYLAVYAQNGLSVNRKPPLTEKELLSPGINTNWLVKAASRSEAGDFKSFIAWHLAHTPVKEKGKLVFRDMTYGQMEFETMKETVYA